ncbi:MAG: thiamine pyrophosphokinase [Desulforhopalus sp.]|jgi:thiamine pyrophosphokinase
MNALILANGELHTSTELLEITQSADFLIAADGGARHCSTLQRTPETLIGDLDSIPIDLLHQFQDIGVEIVQHPTRKNATDLELAIDLSLQKGATAIYFTGMLGGRWDMSLANIFLLASEKYKNIRFTLFGDGCKMHILHPGNNSFTTKPGQRASLLPLKGDGGSITLTGFEYPLDQYTIPFGSSIGVSNVTADKTVHIKHRAGVLLFIVSSNSD